MNHQEHDIYALMSRGRTLRSQAFRDSFAWVARGVKSLFAAAATPAPKAKRAEG